jgi:hypothetical protein
VGSRVGELGEDGHGYREIVIRDTERRGIVQWVGKVQCSGFGEVAQSLGAWCMIRRRRALMMPMRLVACEPRLVRGYLILDQHLNLVSPQNAIPDRHMPTLWYATRGRLVHEATCYMYLRTVASGLQPAYFM